MEQMAKLGCPSDFIFYIKKNCPDNSGNQVSVDILSKGGVSYPPQSAFCLETQHFPDSPNHKNFPSAELSPGDEYEQIATFQFTAE